MEKSTDKSAHVIKIAATLISLSLIIVLMYSLQTVLLPLLFSILIAMTLLPLALFLEKLKLGRAFSALISVILAIAVLSGLMWFIVHQVIIIGKNGTELQTKFLSIFDTIQLWLYQEFGLEPTEIAQYVRTQTDKIVSYLGSSVSSAFGSLGSTLASAVLVPLFSFFLLYYRNFFKEFFFKAFHNTPADKINTTLNKIYEVVQSYLLGMVMVMGIVAVLNTVGLWILGIQYAWFFGTLASLLMLLPYIGIAIGSILPAIFALATKDSAWYALGVIIWFQVVQFLEGNLITPNIVGGKVSINPLMAIISILLGGMIFGLAGLILALPITASLKVMFDASPSLRAFGFLIGEPERRHLRVNSKPNSDDFWESFENKVRKRTVRKRRLKQGNPPADQPVATDDSSLQNDFRE